MGIETDQELVFLLLAFILVIVVVCNNVVFVVGMGIGGIGVVLVLLLLFFERSFLKIQKRGASLLLPLRHDGFRYLAHCFLLFSRSSNKHVLNFSLLSLPLFYF